MGTKHIPQRTCIACRNVRGKRELARVVRTPENQIEIDPTGKKSGRGAYMCRTRECWEIALNTRRLEQALKLETAINVQDLARLREFAATLPSRTASPMVSAQSGEGINTGENVRQREPEAPQNKIR